MVPGSGGHGQIGAVLVVLSDAASVLDPLYLEVGTRNEREGTSTMSFVNYSSREINCKIVYYGPGSSGKSTTLNHIHEKTNSDEKSKIDSSTTEPDPSRTLSFDFLPLSLGEIHGFKVRFHFYALTGQASDASRKLILKGADGVVFVADSQSDRMDANQESLESLRTNLAEHGSSLEKIPFVIQYNKRDLPAIASVEKLRALHNPTAVPEFESTASSGEGVFEAFKAVAKLILTELRKNPPF